MTNSNQNNMKPAAQLENKESPYDQVAATLNNNYVAPSVATTKDKEVHPVGIETNSKGGGFKRGFCTGLCCCCCLDMCF